MFCLIGDQMAQLPPEDLPSGTGLVPGSIEDAVRDAGPMGPENPVAVAFAFFAALTEDDGPNLGQLRELVTAESWDEWGDFGWARHRLDGYGLTTRVERRSDGIAYARFVPTGDEIMVADTDVLITGARILSLIWRPELGIWQVHGLGDYWRPEGPLIEE
jgi:hypothetical protein